MKVLVVGTGGALSGSGITTSTDQTVTALRDMGHDAVRLVSGSRLRRRPNRVNLENLLAVAGEGWELGRATRRQRPDVVWLHTFGVPTLPALRTLAQVVAARLSCRTVLVRFQAFGLERHVADAGWLLRSALRAIGAVSSRLLAEHQAAAAALEPFARGRVVSLPNWVEVPDQPVAIPESPPYRAVFVGGLVSRKGVPQLVEALRLLDDLPFELTVVGGPGDEGPEAAAAIQRAGADLVRRGRLRFAGQLPPDAVRDQLRASHLFVLPSEAEGMPLSMLEALAEGRPVVVSDAGNMADVVREADCGVVLASTSPPHIAEALRRELGDHARLVGAGARAHRVARARYSVAKAAAQISEILEECP